MKQYYTLIQEFTPEPASGKKISEYLTDQGIEYDLGADFAEEFVKKGHRLPDTGTEKLMSKCVALIEDHELSAIMLSVSGVTIVDNRPFINLKNKIRRCLKWFLK